MGVVIKYRGLGEGHVVTTPQGRFPDPRAVEAGRPDASNAPGLVISGFASQLQQQIRATEQERVLSEVALRVDRLARLIDNLHTPESDVVGRAKTAVSPRPDSLAVTADQEATAPASHTIAVRWPSQGREIRSSLENPVEPVSLDDGVHTFTLAIGDTEKTIAVQVNNSGQVDTSEDLLQRMARAISGEDARVAAEVVSGTKDAYDPAPRSRPMDRTVQLRVYSTEEGMGEDIVLSDASGELISTYGLNYAPPRRDARVETEGTVKSQSTDSFTVDDGHVSGQAKATTGDLEVPVRKGPQVISSELNLILDTYNGLIDYLDANQDLVRPSLKDRLLRPLEERFRELPTIGLKATPQGRIDVQKKFQEEIAGDFGNVRSVLLGSEGWVPALRDKLSQVQDLPEDAFAVDLEPTSSLSTRQRAWDLVGETFTLIINQYA